jgi:hypothetical protein
MPNLSLIIEDYVRQDLTAGSDQMKLMISPIRNQAGLEDMLVIYPFGPLSSAVITLRNQQSSGLAALVMAVRKHPAVLVYALEPNEGSTFSESVPASYNRNKQ